MKRLTRGMRKDNNVNKGTEKVFGIEQKQQSYTKRMLRVSSPINYDQVGCKSENVPVPAFLQELWRKRSPANIQPRILEFWLHYFTLSYTSYLILLSPLFYSVKWK